MNAATKLLLLAMALICIAFHCIIEDLTNSTVSALSMFQIKCADANMKVIEYKRLLRDSKRETSAIEKLDTITAEIKPDPFGERKCPKCKKMFIPNSYTSCAVFGCNCSSQQCTECGHVFSFTIDTEANNER